MAEKFPHEYFRSKIQDGRRYHGNNQGHTHFNVFFFCNSHPIVPEGQAKYHVIAKTLKNVFTFVASP